VRCCGEDRQTPFCPLCGRPLRQAGPLETLLAYLRLQARNHRRRLEETERAGGKYERLVASRRRTVAKWEGWVAALEGLTGPGEKV
jgi:hypothetical protein